jgi:hypothetical protein
MNAKQIILAKIVRERLEELRATKEFKNDAAIYRHIQSEFRLTDNYLKVLVSRYEMKERLERTKK